MNVKSIVGLLLLAVVVGCGDKPAGPAVPSVNPSVARPKGETGTQTVDADGNVVEGEGAAGKTQPSVD